MLISDHSRTCGRRHLLVATLSVLSIICGSHGNWADQPMEFVPLQDPRPVNTSAGIAHGYPVNTKWGTVVRYLAIPYAIPPTGNQRFKASTPLLHQKQKKPQVFQSKVFGRPCTQPPHPLQFTPRGISQGAMNSGEDCLTLNIYQPSSIQNRTHPIPILIFVPGDGFSFSDASQYDGSALALLGDILVVTINYRVGILGFLTSGDSTVEGNAGLTDIISAIKFVSLNAPAFFADNRKITVAGRFSGAMALSSLVTSPMFYKDDKFTLPLANKVIIHGGVAAYNYSVNPHPERFFQKLVNHMNCHIGSTSTVFRCLQNIPLEQLVKAEKLLNFSPRPAIDYLTLPMNPIRAIEMGNFSSSISFLVGDNKGSGSICYDIYRYLQINQFHNLSENNLSNDQYKELISLGLKDLYSSDDPYLTKMAAHQYKYHPLFGNKPRHTLRDALMLFCGVAYIRNHVELFARYASRQNSVVYRYELAYRPTTSIYPEFFVGALGEEISMLFPPKKSAMNDIDERVSRIMQKIWINFIKSGNPFDANTSNTNNFNEYNKKMATITKKGVVISSTETLDTDITFWRDLYVPLLERFKQDSIETAYLLSNDDNCQKSTAGTWITYIMAALGIITLIVTTTYSTIYLYKKYYPPSMMATYVYTPAMN